MLIEGIILKCSSNLQGERSGSAIYHLLKGKKSIQTVQDVHIYSLENFYGIYKSVSKTQYNNKLMVLLKNGLIKHNSDSNTAYTLTGQGEKWLYEHEEKLPLDYYKGLKYHEIGNIYFDRLTLLIQTLANSKMGYFSFIPVIDKPDIENWVKLFYKRMRPKEPSLLPALYDEIYLLLDNLNDQEAGIFVDRLTGYKKYGMSLNQLADKYQLTMEDVQLLLVAIIHRMLDNIISNQNSFPFMTTLIKDLLSHDYITRSAYTTYQLLLKGYSIDQITRIRQLKANTIHDHIVEIALYYKEFPINSYVSDEHQEEIINAIHETQTRKLKDIKQLVNQDISYFQIRLVIARGIY
ncbi:YpbB family protein [Virgibacillus ainsalahensis]